MYRPKAGPRRKVASVCKPADTSLHALVTVHGSDECAAELFVEEASQTAQSVCRLRHFKESVLSCSLPLPFQVQFISQSQTYHSRHH